MKAYDKNRKDDYNVQDDPYDHNVEYVCMLSMVRLDDCSLDDVLYVRAYANRDRYHNDHDEDGLVLALDMVVDLVCLVLDGMALELGVDLVCLDLDDLALDLGDLVYLDLDDLVLDLGDLVCLVLDD